MALENETIISFQNVTKQYPNGVLGLKDLNIDIKKGEFVIVVGLSGAGKSTMLRSINRLHEITSGEILIDNKSKRKRAALDSSRHWHDFPKLQFGETFECLAKRLNGAGGLSSHDQNAAGSVSASGQRVGISITAAGQFSRKSLYPSR